MPMWPMMGNSHLQSNTGFVPAQPTESPGHTAGMGDCGSHSQGRAGKDTGNSPGCTGWREGREHCTPQRPAHSPGRAGTAPSTHKPLCAAKHRDQILEELLPRDKTGLSTPVTKNQVTLPTFPQQPRFELSRQRTEFLALGRAFPPLNDPIVSQTFSLMDIYSPREQQTYIPTLFHAQISIPKPFPDQTYKPSLAHRSKYSRLC